MAESGFELVVTPDNRDEIAAKLASLPEGWRIAFKRPKRSLDQNAKMWAMLGEMAKQAPIYYGLKVNEFDYKDICTASLEGEVRTAPSIDGQSLVILRSHYTHDMDDETMGNLIALIESFGASLGVHFKAPQWFDEMSEKQRTAKRAKA